MTLASVSASDKVYDGTQVASVSGTVAGVIGQDAVSLAGGSGTFADRNFGTGKTVAVSGFQLAGVDAGNYALTSNSGVAQASIAQRALSTWIGAAGGLWSDAANWEGGVAPSGANVLAADFAASTGNVVYTAAAGDTVLNSFTSRGGLNLTGGSLLVNGALSTANYAQSGGLLGGSGNVTVSNSFSQSGGAINIGGNLAVTQATGDLRFAALTANSHQPERWRGRHQPERRRGGPQPGHAIANRYRAERRRQPCQELQRQQQRRRRHCADQYQRA